MTALFRPFTYDGRKIYPLQEIREKGESHCQRCLFYPPQSSACDAMGATRTDGADCIDHDGNGLEYYWADGEAAQLQYIKERLTT